MKSQFWGIVVVVLLSAYLLAAFVANDPPGIEVDIARHVIAVGWLTVVWAIVFRTELESRKLSLRSLFALVTIQAFGFWLVRITDSYQ
jgi:hypothetical protein